MRLEDLKFESPPRVIGRGSFGLVLLADYRGTKVAVKRVVSSVQGTKGAESSALLSQSSRASSSRSGTLSTGTFGSSNIFGFRSSQRGSKLQAEFVSEMRLLSKLRHPSITTLMGTLHPSL